MAAKNRENMINIAVYSTVLKGCAWSIVLRSLGAFWRKDVARVLALEDDFGKSIDEVCSRPLFKLAFRV